MATSVQDFRVKNGLLVTTTATIESSLNSSSTTTGALRVVGGAGIGGNLYVGGEIVATKLTIELTTVTTTLVTTDDVIKTTNSTNATSTTTGALVVTGGAGIGRDMWIGGSLNVAGGINASVTGIITTATTIAITNDPASSSVQYLTFVSSSTSYQSIKVDASELTFIPSTGNFGIGTITPLSKLTVVGTASISGITTVTNTSSAISTNTGALQVVGGVGVGGNIFTDGIVKIGNHELLGTNTWVRKYASGYSVTHIPTEVHEIGRVTLLNASENITITGEIRAATGALTGVSRFILGIRSNTLPSKSLSLYEDAVNLGIDIQVKVYENTATGLVLIGYTSPASIQNIGWTLNVQERGNYNYLQQVTTLTTATTATFSEIVATTTAVQEVTGIFDILNVTNATSTTTGALVVTGGAGIGGNVWIQNDANLVAGQLISTRANNANTGAAQIYLNGTTGNRIDFNVNGVGAPIFTTRSVGTKIVLYPNLSGSAVDYALGIESSTLWSSVPNTSSFFRWYGGTTLAATLTGAGNLTLVGDLAVNGSNLTTTQTTFNLINTTVTAVNFAGTATALTVGATTGYTNIRNNTTVTSVTAASSTTTGALVVTGGVGIGGNLYVGGEIVAQKLTIELTTVTTTLVTTDDIIRTTNATNATSTTTGALQVTGGAGIGGDLYARNIYTNGSQVIPFKMEEFTATGGQTTFTVTGGYIVGTVMVFANGVFLNSADFTASNGTTVVLPFARNTGDIIKVIAGGTSSAVNQQQSFSIAMSVALGM